MGPLNVRDHGDRKCWWCGKTYRQVREEQRRADMLKLSGLQMHVIRRMQEGWELGSGVYTIGHTRMVAKGVLQKDGLGHGHPMENVKWVTILSLLKRKLITPVSGFHGMTPYRLTEKGKQVKIEGVPPSILEKYDEIRKGDLIEFRKKGVKFGEWATEGED